MRSLLGKWKEAGRERLGLDAILSQVVYQKSLHDRLEWLIDLFQWLKAPGRIELTKDEFKTGQVQATRIRYLLMVLEKNESWKTSVSETLRAILMQTNALNLYCATGLPSEANFFSEAVDRFMNKVLPTPPHDDDLAEVFLKLFSSIEDTAWLKKLDSQTLSEIWRLFVDENNPKVDVGKKIISDIEDSLLLLTGQVRTYGLEPKIRMRMTPGRIQSLPFFEITFSGRSLIQQLNSEDLFARRKAISEFREVIARCHRELKEAYSHLDVFGVSITIVYQLDRIKSLLNRIESLVRILSGENTDPKKIVLFLCNLIEEVQRQKSFRSFFAENLSLISMKIAQRSAETGSHYISRTRSDYFLIFSKASGGGFMTSFTAMVKILIESFKDVPYFFQGLLTSVNYSISFVWIYLAGFTLATKQPAMTANALAEKMENLDSESSQNDLVNEVVHLVRSQAAATLGNLAAVIPSVLAIDVIIYFLSGQSMMSFEKGMDVLKSHSAIGLSPLHAAFTGVLLWFSSILAGWIDNWSAYREIPQAIAANRKLKNFLGPTKLLSWVQKYQKNLAGWAGNITLGFLLGMSPKILGFFGIPLDVRHVTLSSGVITFASSSIGLEVFKLSEFWWAIGGIFLIGLMNIGVSFFLALFVALRSRRIDSNTRDTIYNLLWRRLLSQPLSFFWLPKLNKNNENLK